MPVTKRKLVEWMRVYWPKNTAVVMIPYCEEQAAIHGLEVDYDSLLAAAVYCQAPVEKEP